MKNPIVDFLTNNKLDLKGETIVVGVSTGVDSMVLLNELMRIRAQIGFDIIVAHINHQKREQSISEEKFIKDFCKEHNIIVYVKRLELKEITEGNFQSIARNKRYEFFKEVMIKNHSRYLFLGHHANDNIETMIMRIIRGSNLSGYSGMDPVTSFGDFYILRPFLNILKEDIVRTAAERNIVFYEDLSNNEAYYTRNRIRQEIVPLLFMENASVDKQFAHFSFMLKGASSIVNKKIDEYLQSNVIFFKNHIQFSQDNFLKNDLFLQTEIIFSLTKDYDLSKANVDELLKLINSNKANLLVKFKENLTFVKEYNIIKLFFYNISFKKTYLIIDGCGIYDIDEKRQIIVTKKSDKNLTNLNSLWYNSNMLPIIIRSREAGDRISLSSGSKKVSNLLTDKKIGILQREQILIATDNNNNILSVFGVEKSSLLKSIFNCDIIITLKEKK